MRKQYADPFGARKKFETGSGPAFLYHLAQLEKSGFPITSLPYSIRIVLESVLRNCDGRLITKENVTNLAKPDSPAAECPFLPARVLLQDFTGVPALVDLAAMRSAIHRLGGAPKKIEPLIPCDLVIDHSIQVDVSGVPDALVQNMNIEFDRNRERYEFLKWGQNAFKKFRIIPPGVGIIHQVNLEYLARGVYCKPMGDLQVVYPDSLVGTDSHTTMINGLGIVGWGVGGIEAEAVLLGQPIFMLTPQVVGFKLSGELPQGATATDLALRVVELLRQKGVVGKFVEFYGPGVNNMSLPDRATIANMAPEYGATMGFFPIDNQSLIYLRQTGRDPLHVKLVERYFKEQALFRTENSPVPVYSDTIECDLGGIEPSVAGPKRPQDRIPVSGLKKSFNRALTEPFAKRGFQLNPDKLQVKSSVQLDDLNTNLKHGSVVIASITSCTNTSNPSVLIAAGLLAKKAVEKGLAVAPTVKTSLAPGSRVVSKYLSESGLGFYLEQLGFYTVGYGCTVCIGNSGPLPGPVVDAIEREKIVAAAVLSGNRNFEGRVSPHTKANYLASPPLVVAFAIAGTVDIDLTTDALGTGKDGQPVFLSDIWPSRSEIFAYLQKATRPEFFTNAYKDVNIYNPRWSELKTVEGELYRWQETSTYIQEPPFFTDLHAEEPQILPINSARVLVMLGDSVTTDHISPAGTIPGSSPAAQYLRERGITDKEFNTYGSRRGNDQIMVRGTFGNIRLKNLLVPGMEGDRTLLLPDGKEMAIYDASVIYKERSIPLIVLAGKEYGTGSSRDWAAKGTNLLGIKAVIAESFERIHRSNLIGMGVLPLEFIPGESVKTLDLTGRETYSVKTDNGLKPGQEIVVSAGRDNGQKVEFKVKCRLDTPVEISYYRNGGILHAVLRQMLRG
ncbi:aconitate hydratase AcnA [candidate division KSB1 bacterium]|nr:aconitate hydratase AcnA [candidate division KSB1 bacterium]